MDRTLFLLILSDIFILSGFGLITPILAIFIKEGLTGGSVVSAGLAISIFWVLKSILQLPLSKYVDSRKKKLKFLLLGTFIIIIVPFMYAFSQSVTQIYLAQAVYACGAALAYPTWMSLFITHVDKKHKGFEWSIWSTGVGLGTGIAAFIGAKIADLFGFSNLFFIVGSISILGFILLFFIENKMWKINALKTQHPRIIKSLKK